MANIDEKLLNSVYVSLGMAQPEDTSDYKISTKNYVLFLRILYNATFLSREYSEKALEILSQANFKDGLVAGLPQGLIVAHKFGEKVNSDGSGHITSIEFHDCGIVYASSTDYVLCVMTKGNDYKKLLETIKKISTISYSGLPR